MPAYNFKKTFADQVKGGLKKQTIRPVRKRQTRAGEKLKLYTGMRTKGCRLLRETTCLSVTSIEIGPEYVKLNGQILGMDARKDLAKKDGFQTLAEFYNFFIQTYGIMTNADPLKMELIEWD
ncbi:MAG: hypothetical protein GY765_15105 [bacterium]|nr:hypothetical protein [bacterium]